MSTSDENEAQPRGGEGGAGTAHAPQAETSAGARHGRGRRSGGRGRHEQQQGRPQQQSRRGDSTLNLEELRELTELFSTHGLTDFEFENADIRIRLSRNPAPAASAPTTPQQAAQAAQAAHAAATVAAPPAAAGAVEAQQQPAAPAPAEEPEEVLHVITSPIVGTFYRSPSPTAEPFVKVGSQVESDSVVCIIEAMKLMNEIQAETAGTIAKIYVENGQPVEYGQPLFGVKK